MQSLKSVLEFRRLTLITLSRLQIAFKVEDHNTLPDGPGQVLTGDITYLKLGSSFLYLAVVIDIFTREVVGCSMGQSLKTRLDHLNKRSLLLLH